MQAFFRRRQTLRSNYTLVQPLLTPLHHEKCVPIMMTSTSGNLAICHSNNVEITNDKKEKGGDILMYSAKLVCSNESFLSTKSEIARSTDDLHSAEIGEVKRDGHADGEEEGGPSSTRFHDAVPAKDKKNKSAIGRIVHIYQDLAMTDKDTSRDSCCKRCDPRIILIWSVDPSSSGYYWWLGIMTITVLYNLILIIARTVFWKLQEQFIVMWLCLDYICDIIYLIDLFIRSRTAYLEQGLLTRDITKTRKNYIAKMSFKFDLISILPTDILYFIPQIGLGMTIVRINRLFHIHRMYEFFDRTETRTSYPNVFRILKLILYILIVIHWNACFYFQISSWIGFGTDGWVYFDIDPILYPVNASLSRMYIYSFYWSTLTLTTIGETPSPEENAEIVFVTIDFLIGVLILASTVGNIGSMITNMNAERAKFQHKMDGIKQYMEFRKVSTRIEKRVIKWFEYLWTNKESMDEESILATLPDTLKSEIAVHVHLATLRRVAIFQDCEPGLLVQLVLKLKLAVYSPGDYICRKGDIGREMYIIKRGQLSVVAEDGIKVLATLKDGLVFAEISILNIVGNKNGNRRTANIRSIGYSDLYVLNKDDLWDALKEYPEAKKVLMDRGRQILIKDNLYDEQIARKHEQEQESQEQMLLRVDSSLHILRTRFERLSTDYDFMQKKLQQQISLLKKTEVEFEDSLIASQSSLQHPLSNGECNHDKKSEVGAQPVSSAKPEPPPKSPEAKKDD